jgi:hypothetical protein
VAWLRMFVLLYISVGVREMPEVCVCRVLYMFERIVAVVVETTSQREASLELLLCLENYM